MNRTEIRPDGLSDPTDHYFVPAIVANGTLYTSGQVATDERGDYVGDDAETQARQVVDNVARILEAADRGFEDVVTVTSYLVDIDANYEDYHSVYCEVFEEEPYPCHTAVGVERLASDEPLVEVEVTVPMGESDA